MRDIQAFMVLKNLYELAYGDPVEVKVESGEVETDEMELSDARKDIEYLLSLIEGFSHYVSYSEIDKQHLADIRYRHLLGGAEPHQPSPFDEKPIDISGRR